MGKITNGILGGVSGKVGGVVGSNWKGIDTLRAYAIPANPQSTAQTTQRTLFSAVLTFAKLILTTIIQNYWDPFAVQQSGYNAFMSANLLAWADDTAYDDAIIAQGSLESEDISSAVYSGGDVTVAYTAAGLGNGLGTDSCVIVIVDTGNNVAFVSDGITTRSEEGDALTIGTGRTVGDLKAYMFFYRGSGDTLEVSNSTYLQVTT